ncbi:hypothetical protein BDD12DRAFT_882353 [Trichophaea hybrida]|nr:hypothetical protein BDD12DRAFT_882353 [Trichophaea hybrida]
MAAITKPKSVEQWTCTICDRTMTANVMDAHLQGKPHHRCVLGLWYCDACRVTVTLANKAVHVAGKHHARWTQEWHCDVCGTSNPLFKKGGHLAGKKHTKNAAAAITGKKQGRPPNADIPKLKVHDISIDLGDKPKKHAAEKHAAARPKPANRNGAAKFASAPWPPL